jgi:hypothetical protein
MNNKFHACYIFGENKIHQNFRRTVFGKRHCVPPLYKAHADFGQHFPQKDSLVLQKILSAEDIKKSC